MRAVSSGSAAAMCCPASPSDGVCAKAGSAFGELALVAATRPIATPYALAAYSGKNQEQIPAQCPDASDVCGFHAWLNVGRVVRKGDARPWQELYFR